MTMINDSEIRSLMTLSSKSEGSLAHQARTHWHNAALHARCTTQHLDMLRETFAAAHRQVMVPEEFRELLREKLNVEYDDDEFNILILKINTNRDGEISWDELVSHLLLGYLGDDPDNQREALEPPVMGLPRLLRSMHRHPVSRICFCPDVSKERTTDPLQGSYMTASRDGMINWWSLNMTLLRSAYSSSPHLKVRSTWVTDMVCMPDVNIVVTSSTERDLRFYDCTAKTFTLKMIISSWEYMIVTMHYHFEADERELSVLLCGDAGGGVRVLRFCPALRGPFQSRAARALVALRHVDLQKRPRMLPQLQLLEVPGAHADWVRQVGYYAALHSAVSCATGARALRIAHVTGVGAPIVFHVDKGVQCFAFDESTHVLVTGGPDGAVRVWSPFAPARPSVVLHGHHAGVVALVLQRAGRRVYSLARDRVLKVWDVQAQMCVQTYIDVPSQVGERTPISAAYNPATRELLLAAIKIAVLTLEEQLNPQHTDGFTHSRAVAKVLYNPLFKVVVTCGLDSIIMNWNPLTGKRNILVRDAHTRQVHGELVPMEITAACFDSAWLLLLTGARNGSLKVWNFNSGLCLRTMSIEYMAEVTNVFWAEGRIFAVGWNRHVTEFSGDTSAGSGAGKAWETRHASDVLAAAARAPLTLATGSYSSELVLWKLETGQPYRRYSCTEPMLRIKMHYSKRDAKSPPAAGAGAGGDDARPGSSQRKMSVGAPRAPRTSVIDAAAAVRAAHARRVSSVALPARAQQMRQLAVHAMLFLETRPHHMFVASLMVALENGLIQGWSDHPAGGFQGAFQATHTAGDYVSALATDLENELLICGTTAGYIKVWLMTNYLSNEQVHVNMPRLRLQFPFLWRDRVEGRAKRAARGQPRPLLLSSHRAHLRTITSIAFIDEHKLVLSGSSDYSVRVWRLSGEYLQTLGGLAPWTLAATRIPPDVQKVASSTTLKVWRGGQVSRYVPGQVEEDKLRDITEQELRTRTYGAPPAAPLLGNSIKLPARPERRDPVQLDASLPTIPLYAHLRMASTQPVRRPPTPELVRRTRLARGAPAKKAHFEGPGAPPAPAASALHHK